MDTEIESARTSLNLTRFDNDLYSRVSVLSRQQGKTTGELLTEAMKLLLERYNNRAESIRPLPKKVYKTRPRVFVESKLVWDYMWRNKLTESALAEKLDVARETLNRVLHHRQGVSPTFALKLVDTTGIGYLELFPQQNQGKEQSEQS